jgi:hypothetical protein
MSQSLKKTFITTVLTAVKKNKQPAHTPGGPGRLKEEEEEEEEDLFVFNDTIEGPRAPAVKPGRVTQA